MIQTYDQQYINITYSYTITFVIAITNMYTKLYGVIKMDAFWKKDYDSSKNSDEQATRIATEHRC